MEQRTFSLSQPGNHIKNWIYDIMAKVQQQIPPHFDPSTRESDSQQDFQQGNFNGSSSYLALSTGLVSPQISSASSSQYSDNNRWQTANLDQEQHRKETKDRNSPPISEADRAANKLMDKIENLFKPTTRTKS